MLSSLGKKQVHARGRISAFLQLIFSQPYLYAFFAVIALRPRALCDMDALLASVLQTESFPLFRTLTYVIVTLTLIAYLLRWALHDIKRVNPTLLCILGLFMYLAVITFVFDGASGYHIDWHAGFALMLMADMGLQRERKSFIRGLTGAFEFWVYLNVISYVIFPNSLVPKSLYPVWILDKHVFYYRTVLPALALALVRWQLLGSQYKARGILLMICCLICFAMQGGGTALVGLALLAGMMLWCNRRAVPRYMTPLAATGVAAAVFAGIYFFGLEQAFEPLITGVLDKSITLTGRTEIWQGVMPAIAKNPITGIGYLPVAFLREMLGGSHFSHTHNQLLLLMLHGGVIATAIYLAALHFASREAVRYRRSTAVKTMTLLASTFALMGVVEIFHNDPVYYALFVFLSRADCLAEGVKQQPRISLIKRIKRDLKIKKATV